MSKNRYRGFDMLTGQDSVIVASGLNGSPIKLIQRGTVTIGSGATSATASITAVILANTRLVFLGYTTSVLGATVTENNCYLELTNTTTVTATHATAGNTIVASFGIIEYWPGVIRSIQRGTNAITAGNTTAASTVTAVNLEKSELDNLGVSFTNADATASGPPNQQANVVITNSTTVTSTRVGTSDALTQSYQLTEWW